MMRITRPGTFTASLLLSLTLCSMAQTAGPRPLNPATMPVGERVRKELVEFKGKVILFAKNLDSGATFGIGEDQRVRTASTIKVAVMVEAFARVAEGKAKWSDEVVLTTAKKVGGSGILQELSDGLRLNLRDAVTLMMTLSDNTATNLVLDALTTDAVNARMESLGLHQTRVLRKVFGGGISRAGEDPALKPYGLGVTTPHEMVTLLEKLERGEVVSREASKEMLALMKREQVHAGIGRTLNGVEMATKSGALDQLRSNVGIIYSKRGRIAMAITCDDMPEADWTEDNAGLLMLSRLSLILMDGLGQSPANEHR
ncbi:MAG TPA: serine hydrolase [Blastocatellia bacterium]|nr:serine hydrolase [Blastocatellia bacterium]